MYSTHLLLSAVPDSVATASSLLTLLFPYLLPLPNASESMYSIWNTSDQREHVTGLENARRL
jgi:hypothetical protein